MAIYGPTSGLKERTFELWVLNRWVLISASALPHCGESRQSHAGVRSKSAIKMLLLFFIKAGLGSQRGILYANQSNIGGIYLGSPLFSMMPELQDLILL